MENQDTEYEIESNDILCEIALALSERYGKVISKKDDSIMLNFVNGKTLKVVVTND